MRYITGLSPEFAAKYYLHFMSFEGDDMARRTLSSGLENLAQNVGNDDISKCVSNPDMFGQSQAPSDMSLGNSRFRESAIAKFEALYLRDSLKDFRAAKLKSRAEGSFNGFYEQRARICLAMGRAAEAQLLGEKGDVANIAFAAAIATGDFKSAERYILWVVGRLKSEGAEASFGAFSVYEAVQLVIYVAMTTMTPSHIKNLVGMLENVTTYDFANLFSGALSFASRDYANVVKWAYEELPIWRLSLYTAKVEWMLNDAIVGNVVRNAVAPIARISLTKLAASLGISRHKLISILKELIREGSVLGKLDLIEGRYVDCEKVGESVERMKILNRVRVVEDRFRVATWRQEYAVRAKL